MEIKYILWDWNGTLLDDVDDCVYCMNTMLAKRGMELIDHTRYREIFTFPVIEYYKTLGYDFTQETFADLAVEYISLYTERSKKSPLHDNVLSVLTQAKSKNIRQFILSAMEQKTLEEQTQTLGLKGFFDDIVGLDNIHAVSKIDNARTLIDSQGIETDHCLMIGDTFHDFEVADQLGTKCLLINNGHQQLHNFSFHKEVILAEQIWDVMEILNV